jgi:hypothetical protein
LLKRHIFSYIIVFLVTLLILPPVTSAQTRETPLLEQVSPTLAPGAGANWEVFYSTRPDLYILDFDWTHVPGSEGYGVSISAKPGDDPGERITTKISKWRFPAVREGSWYVNIKTLKEGKWSPIIYWKVTVRETDAEATPSAILGAQDSEKETSTSEAVRKSGSTAQTDTTDERVLTIRKKIEAILARFNPPEAVTPMPQAENKRSFRCDCTKNCKELASCSEAYFQLYKCGCVNLDPNGDNIPCGTKCGGQ